MSYINQVTGYRKDLLINRSVLKRGMYAVIEPDGLVKNTIPGFEKCEMTILGSPKLGASFVDYLVSIGEGGRNLAGFGGEGVETFFFLFEGKVRVWNEDKEEVIGNGGYIFSPSGKMLCFENEGGEARGFLYKRKYEPLEGYEETHVQEHGALIYSGEGMYNLDNDWIPVKKGDYIFMGAYCLQAAYGVGRDEEFAYLYSKDCNRDAAL